MIAFPNLFLSQREAVAGAGGSGKVRGPSRLPAGAQAMFYIVLLWVEEPTLPGTVAFVFRPRRQRLSPSCVCSVLQHTAASPSASVPLSDARIFVLTLRGGWCPPWAPYLPGLPFSSPFSKKKPDTQSGDNLSSFTVSLRVCSATESSFVLRSLVKFVAVSVILELSDRGSREQGRLT